MVMCWAPGCTHYNQRETCKFYKFPKDPVLRKKWITMVRREAEPGPGAFLCSCHFVDGKRENGPELFQHNQEKRFTFSSPEKKKRKSKELRIDDVSEPSRNEEHVPDSQETEFQGSVEVGAESSIPISSDPQPSTSRGTSQAFSPILVEAGNYFLKQDVHETENKLSYLKSRMSFEHIKNKEDLVLFYTGLPNVDVFESILELIKGVDINYYQNWKVEKLNQADQLLLTLMKLRHNFPQIDLAQRFDISQSTVSNIIITWVHVLHTVLFKTLMKEIPDRKKNRSCLPNCFSTFTNCRIIIDCTEVFTAVPRKSMSLQKATYSSYKHRNTWKGLIGVAPNGVITYISGLYAGSTSDKKIVQHCGLLDQLLPGDLVLADKGFLIRDILPPGVALNLPPFLTTAQFSPDQVKQTENIARARIHVERAIRRMKVYKILQFIPQTLCTYAEEIFQTVGALTNLQYPLIKEVEQYYSMDND